MSHFENQRCWLTVDSAALNSNLARVREYAPNARVMAVIKANGYGHGMEVAAANLDKADEFAVSDLNDLSRLRSAGVGKPITLLSATFNLGEVNQLAEQNARPVIYDWTQLKLLEQLDADAQLHVWLKIDTGMGRLGFLLDEYQTALARLTANPSIASISLMTHLANADDQTHSGTKKQLDYFAELQAAYAWREVSILNSAGVVNFADSAFDMVRPGIMLYGISPVVDRSASQCDLTPVMTLRAKLLSIKRMPTGSTIGYGNSYTLDHDTRVGVVACGYGDGYPRHAPSGTPVLVNGFLVPLIGRVSMDMICVDLGELPASVGDDVTLWGADNPIEDVAKAADTIAYELICNVSERVERIVI